MLADDIRNALPELRRESEALMTSRCIIRRATGEDVRNPETGQLEPATVTVYNGPCEFKFPTAGAMSSKTANAQGQGVTTQLPTLKLPIATSGDIRAGDVAELIENPFDESLIGMRASVTGRHGATYAAARRLVVEVISRA